MITMLERSRARAMGDPADPPAQAPLQLRAARPGSLPLASEFLRFGFFS